MGLLFILAISYFEFLNEDSFRFGDFFQAVYLGFWSDAHMLQALYRLFVAPKLLV